MGIGFCIVVSKSGVDKITHVLDKDKLKYHQVGHVTKGHGSVLISVMGKKYLLND
jgi:phosphoribosylaminoimidazole (AIR) synthetase